MSLSASPTCSREFERPRTGSSGTAAALALAIGLWGAKWPVMKIGLGHVSPLRFSALRFASGAACLILVQIVRQDLRWPKRRD